MFETALKYIEQKLKKPNLTSINQDIFELSGIVEFFPNEKDLQEFDLLLKDRRELNEKKEFGDFQTNLDLARKIVKKIKTEIKFYPKTLIEPTAGTGNFIIAALENFDLEKIYAIEIYKPYITTAKLKILDYFLKTSKANKAQIIFSHQDIFKFNWQNILIVEPLLILGNPPWVTNSDLGQLNSKNLPPKSNIKGLNGIEALTGKGNFDISENIALKLLGKFHKTDGLLALILKQSVIKNLIYSQKNSNFQLSDFQSHKIDAQKEFNASVSAAVFITRLNHRNTDVVCKSFDFYTKRELNAFGWFENNFVSDFDLYKKTKVIEGKSPLVWRQGVKHDAAKVLELTYRDGKFYNKLNELVDVEEDMIFPLLKSSDLQKDTIKSVKTYLLLPSKTINGDINYLRLKYPKLYSYLENHKQWFDKRKSKIYKGKAPFSIFGIGNYTFKAYKVGISSMYKRFNFSLIYPIENKSVILDDTCYFLSFDNYDFALITYKLLNHPLTIDYLKSITFNDNKRVITKEILQRIDLIKLIQQLKNELSLDYNLMKSYKAFLLSQNAIERQRVLVFPA